MEQNADYMLLTILQKYAPTGKEQEEVTRLYRELPADPDTRVAALAGWLLDGLHYGNWPWNRPTAEITCIFVGGPRDGQEFDVPLEQDGSVPNKINIVKEGNYSLDRLGMDGRWIYEFVS